METITWTTKGTFNAMLEDEVSCLLTDLILIGSSIIIVDNENKKIKRFSNKGELRDALLLDDPYGTSLLENSSHIVVTEPGIKFITFISIAEQIQLSSRRKTAKKYQTVCCLDESKLAVGCCEHQNGSVDIIDYFGLVLVTLHKSLSENMIFRTPASISCLHDKCIIVSDSGLGKVVGVNLDGKMEFTYDPGYVLSSICCDKHKLVYMCLYNRNLVRCVKYENQKVVETHFDLYIERPLAMALSKSCLFLTSEVPNGKVTMIEVKETESERDTSLKLSSIHVSIKKESDDEAVK